VSDSWLAALCLGFLVAGAFAQASPTRDDPDSLIAEGDRLVQARRPGEAIGVYRRALRKNVRDRGAVDARIINAEAQRQGFLSTCETSIGEIGRHACEAAWLPGAPDEASVFKRRGIICEAERQPWAALDAYMSADRLRPGDRTVAAEIVKLSESTGRADLLGLIAKGSALITLGRPAEAIKPLHLALRSNPDSAEVKALLRTAERGASAAASAAAAAAAPRSTLESSSSETNERRYSNSAPVTQSH
jgi:tetratricopeptide (TPR) repeat protein